VRRATKVTLVSLLQAQQELIVPCPDLKDGKDGNDGKDGKEGPRGPLGPKGEKGDKGDQGLDGKDGRDGKDGIKGDKGEKGNAGEVGPKGTKGDKGPKGDTGERGLRGDIPILGLDYFVINGAPGPPGKDGVGTSGGGVDVPDGTYVTGFGILTDGSITVTGGVITEIIQAT
jgi:hypothetical protein